MVTSVTSKSHNQPSTLQPNNPKSGKTDSMISQASNHELLPVRPVIRDDGTMGVQYMPDEMMCRILGIKKLPVGYEVGFLDGDPFNNTRANLVLQRIGEGRNARRSTPNEVNRLSQTLECFEEDFHRSGRIIMTENEGAELKRVCIEICDRYYPQLYPAQWIRILGEFLFATYTRGNGAPVVNCRSGRPGLSTQTA
jgi:hypothetical protein